MKILACLLATICSFILVISQNTDSSITTQSSTDTNLDPSWSYCFEFTWVGPYYDNSSLFNQTCADYLDSTRAKNVPCSPPIVITYDGTPPDIDFLFNNYTSNVLCKRAPNQVCATYTYKYDGIVSNSTFMCTKVQEAGGSAITSGCYTEKVRGYEVELCVCKSNRGLYLPCNGNLASWR